MKLLILVIILTMTSKTVSNTCSTVYSKVTAHLREITALEGINGLIGWDEMVMQPEGASSAKAKQKSALAGVLFDKRTSSEYGENLAQLQKMRDELDDVQQAVLDISIKKYRKMTCIPKSMATRIAELETEGYQAWIQSREASDFNVFAPKLKEWVDLSIEKAKLIDSVAPTYDTLLDEFEKGMTGARIDEIFAEVRKGLVPLIKEIKEKGTPPDISFLQNKEFDVKKQAAMVESIALDLGFDLKKGRLDVSVHPFTGGSHPSDVRMTTRFKKDDITEGLTGAIHETGHSLYEQGRNSSPEWIDLPVSEALSMGAHESQSLLWERMIALSRPFQDYLLPKLQMSFPDEFSHNITADQLYGAINVVKFPSLIRVEADEVTYTMHVILRYEIERALIEGTLKVEDVNKMWNEKMEEYLFTKPDSDLRGSVQDLHWSQGAIGYFPTYSLGAMAAVQIYEAANKDIPSLEDQISRGEFSPLKTWLNENIHSKGSLFPNLDELLVKSTGKPLDPQVFISYLRDKYSKLYKL